MATFYTDTASIEILSVTNLTAVTSSVQYFTSSQFDVGTNIITLNTTSPLRYGGIAVADSGSSPIRSGSLLFDSQNNQWIYVHQNAAGSAVTSSVLIMGPQTFNNIGNETTITANRLTKGQTGDLGEHITSSNITDDGTTVSINSNTQITGSLITSQNVSVGTTQTTSPLTVVSSTSPLITIQSTTANSYSNMRFSGSGRAYTVGVGNASETLLGVANDYFVYDDTAGAIRMVIDSAGNAGIGTTAPVTKLQVVGTVSASSFTGDGSGITGITATAAPAGPNRSVQFNDSGTTSGSTNFTFDKTTNTLILTGSFQITGSNTSRLMYTWQNASSVIAASGSQWLNMPAATASFGNPTTTTGQATFIADLTDYTQARFWTSVQIAGAATNTALLLQYSTDNSAWNAFGSPLVISNTTGAKDSGWFAIPAGSKTFVYIRLVGYGGNGTADPTFSPPTLIIR